jgi:hypothetical protein
MSAGEPTSPSILVKYRAELSRLKTALDLAFGAGVTNNVGFPEDRVVFPLGVASRNLQEEIIWLVNAGFGVAALRTARTLYECVVFSWYLNKYPATWEAYLDSMHAQWANVLLNVPDAANALPEMHKAISAKVPRYAANQKKRRKKLVSLDWNDARTTYNMASAIGISDHFHSLAFSYNSGFVHPSAVFILGSMVLSPRQDRLTVGSSRQEEESMLALRVTHDMTLAAIRLRLKYSESSALSENLKSCEADFLAIWHQSFQLKSA